MENKLLEPIDELDKFIIWNQAEVKREVYKTAFENWQFRMMKHMRNRETKFDMLLCNSYELGEKEAYGKALSDLSKKFRLVEKWRKVCFCMGEPRWRPFCGQCQDWMKLSYKTGLSSEEKKDG